MISFTVPGTPVSVNHYARHCIVRGQIRRYKSREAVGFAADLAYSAQGLQVRSKNGYEVSYRIYHGKGERGDIDNRAKVLLDALVSAGVIDSDAKVKRLIAEKFRDPVNPRTEIEVREYETR